MPPSPRRDSYRCVMSHSGVHSGSPCWRKSPHADATTTTSSSSSSSSFPSSSSSALPWSLQDHAQKKETSTLPLSQNFAVNVLIMHASFWPGGAVIRFLIALMRRATIKELDRLSPISGAADKAWQYSGTPNVCYFYSWWSPTKSLLY